MRGFVKGCIITALVCILIGIIVLTASVTTLGWGGIRSLAKQGVLNASFWGRDYVDYVGDWDDVHWEIESAKQELQDAKAELTDELGELGWEISTEIEEALKDAMYDISDTMYESLEGGMEAVAKARRDYQSAGGDNKSEVIAGTDQIENLRIDFRGGALHLLSSEDNQVHIITTGEQNEFKFTCYMEDDTLILKDGRNNRIANYNNRHVYLALPENIVFDNAQISVGGGLLTAESIQAEDISISVGAGQGVLDSIYAEVAEFNIGAGEMLVNRGVVEDVELDIGAGHGVYVGTIHCDLNVECKMGAAELVLTGSSAEHNYHIDAAVGSVMVDQKSYSGVGFSQNIDNAADSDFYLKNSMGTIKLEFAE